MTNSPRELAAYLERTVATELPNLRAIPEGPATAAPNRPSGEGWSRREEIGHLIDSAVNNHARFVRATLEPTYEGPGYEQDGWIAVHRYNETPWNEIVDVWHAHNRVLLRLIAAIPPTKLATPCRVGGVGGSGLVTLGFMIDDYVLHMRHHLDNVLRRSPPTKYPRDGE